MILTPCLAAGFPVVAVTTHEESRFLQDVLDSFPDRPVWTIASRGGLRDERTGAVLDPKADYPIAIDRAIEQPGTLLVVYDWQKYCLNAPVYRALKQALARLKSSGSCVVLVAPAWQLPLELQHDVRVLDYPLPDRDQRAAAVAVITESPDAPPIADDIRAQVLDNTSGLTLQEVEDSVAVVLSKTGGYSPLAIQNEKMAQVKQQSGCLQVYQPVDPDQVGGMGGAKDWIVRVAIPSMSKPKLRVRAVILCGIAGCLRGETPIYDPTDGTTKTVSERCIDGRPFHVIAKNSSGQPVVAVAQAPINYGPADMLEFGLSTGESIAVTPAHRFWNGLRYVYAAEVAESLREFGPYRLPTISGSGLKAHAEDDRRSTQILPDSLAGCRDDHHFGGEQLPSASKSALTFPLPRVDARQPDHALCSAGGQDGGSSSTPLQRFDHRSMRGSGLQAQTCTAFAPESLDVAGLVRRVPGSYLESLQPPAETGQLHTAAPPLGHVLESSVAGSLEVAARSSGGTAGTVRQALRTLRNVWRFARGSYPVDADARNCQSRPVVLCASPSLTPAGECGTTEYVTVVSCRQAPRADYFDFHVPVYNNYLALGVFHHNTGKSLFSKAMGAYFGRPVLRLDGGAVMGGIVGQSEANMRGALATAEAMAPCVLWIDEVDKFAGGVASSGRSDGGTKAAVVGTLLTWMQEHTADIVVVMTCNDYSQLPTELTRAGRVNQRFFVDLPTKQEREEIALVHLSRLDCQPDFAPAIANLAWDFTGAEIEASIQEAACLAMSDGCEPELRHFEEAIRMANPVAKTDATGIQALRSWAASTFRRANSPEATAQAIGRKLSVNHG